MDASACGAYEADVNLCATDIDELMKTRLLLPFGMTSSGYVWMPPARFLLEVIAPKPAGAFRLDYRLAYAIPPFALLGISWLMFRRRSR